MLRLSCALLLAAGVLCAADVSGIWQFNVETNMGSGSPMVDLKQQGEKLTGTFHSQVLGHGKISGSVTGNAIEFGFEGEAGGEKIKVSYKGTIDSPTEMKGTAVYAGIDDKATWSAVKK